MKILSFGEILWDVYPDRACIGGAPLNFAAHLAKMGRKVFMLSALGKDSLGADALEQLGAWGIDTRYVDILENKETGKCIVTLDESSQPSYNLLSDVAYDYIDTSKVNERFDVLYFGTLALRGEHNFNALKSLINKKLFSDIFVDVNIRAPFYSKESVKFAVENATVLKISLEELPTVASLLDIDFNGDYRSFAFNLARIHSNIKCLIVTLGAEGAFGFDREREYLALAQKVKVVSTVGAGDSFSAAFLHYHLNTEDVKSAMQFATKIAAKVVSSYEAVPEYDA